MNRSEVEPYLGRILGSPAFQSSPKCQAFLRFVVEYTLNESHEPLKERIIAERVFARGDHYNPSEDSLVRVKASEVRRRLSQYYAGTGGPDEWRIELPVGGYVPRFIHQEQGAPGSKVAPAQTKSKRQTTIAVLLGIFLLAGLVVGGIRLSRRAPAIQEFWAPILRSSKPLLIFLPVPPGTYVQSNDAKGGFILHPDRVGMGAAQGMVRFVDLCLRTGKPYIIKAGTDLSFSDLRDHPSVLFGAFSSQWPTEVNNEYRFRLDRRGEGGRIVDSQAPGREWVPKGSRADGWTEIDYAIAARVLDRKSGQTVIIAAGTTTFGTQAAAEFLTSSEGLEELVHLTSKPLGDTNFQVVLRTKVIGNTPGFPSIVATHFWN